MAFNSTLWCGATLPLQHQFLASPAAQSANWSCVPSHSLHSPSLGRSASVVGNRSDVTDAGDGEPGSLERSDGGLAAASGALHIHVHLA